MAVPSVRSPRTIQRLYIPLDVIASSPQISCLQDGDSIQSSNTGLYVSFCGRPVSLLTHLSLKLLECQARAIYVTSPGHVTLSPTSQATDEGDEKSLKIISNIVIKDS